MTLHVKTGKLLFAQGDASDSVYYLVGGMVRLEEVELDVGSGTLPGEIGLLTTGRRRTSTARCKTDCNLLVLSANDAMRILYQDPKFAVYVVHLIASRLEAAKLRTQRDRRDPGP